MDAESRPALQLTLDRVDHLNRQAAAARERLLEEMRGLLGFSTRSREIFESNKIEGVGTTSLAGTVDILRSPTAVNIEVAVNRYDLVRAIEADSRTHDVLGLYSAKLFAEELVADRGRPLTEADLRSMHGLVLGAQAGAGQYRGPSQRFEIANSAHVPPEFWRVPGEMGNLVEWIRCATFDAAAPAVFVAAVAHAWLTHIHPFIDGNGRMARLWANMVLADTPLPALIIKHQPDRGHYLDALSLSDAGGEIAPLVRVFLRALSRGVKEMERPEYAILLFEQELDRRARGPYDRWLEAIDKWTTDLAVLMRQRRCNVHSVGVLDRDTFERYSRGEEMRAVVLAEVTSAEYPGNRVLLVLRRPTQLKARSGPYPAIHLFRRRARTAWDPRLYQRVMTAIDEVVVTPSGGGRHRTLLRLPSGRIRTGHDLDFEPLVDGIVRDLHNGTFRADW